MRILHLYAGNLYGGIERLLVTLARERGMTPGMNPAYGLCFRGRLFEELLDAGVPTYDLGQVRFSRPWTLWQSRRRLRRLFMHERFDLVMTHAAWPHAAFARTVRKAGFPLAHWVHDVMTGRGNRFEERAGQVPPELVVANSRFTADTVPAVFPGVRTEVVHLPVSAPITRPEDRQSTRADLATPADDVVILQACRLERWKGHAVLIEALGLLRARPGWTAWIVGGPQKESEGEYLASLKSRAAAIGIGDRVRFLGQRSDVPRLLAAADIQCQPNTGPEPFGIAFVEALYAGLPVVTTDLGGVREVVTPECGVLVPPNDFTSVAAALAGLMGDPARRGALGAAGRLRAGALCDPARQLARLSDLLRQMTGELAA